MGKKLELKRIQNPNSQHDSFSKCKRGLLKESVRHFVLCDAEVALIIFSETGKNYQFASSKYLITCSLIWVSTNDDILEQLVAKCPLLENLRIEYCTGLRDLKMCAVNLRFLGFAGNHTAESVTVDSPKLVDVRVLDCSYRLNMKLNSCAALNFYAGNDLALWCISATESLRKIKLFGSSMFVISLRALNSFHYLEELIIESMDKVAGSVAANLILRLDNLKKVHVVVSKFSGDEIALVGCLLRSAPSLQTMTLTLPSCPQYIHEKIFLKQLLGLERSSGKASVIITENHSEYCNGCQRSSDDQDQHVSSSNGEDRNKALFRE